MINNLAELNDFVEKEAQERAKKIKKNETPTKEVGAGKNEYSPS